MRLLFDQNLSRHLVSSVRDAFPGSLHLTDVDLETATDAEIWNYAKDHDLVIMSKDSDFRQLAFLHGPPPKVVWLRVGNATTNQIATTVLDHIETIETFVDREDEALLVIPSLARRS